MISRIVAQIPLPNQKHLNLLIQLTFLLQELVTVAAAPTQLAGSSVCARSGSRVHGAGRRWTSADPRLGESPMSRCQGRSMCSECEFSTLIFSTEFVKKYNYVLNIQFKMYILSYSSSILTRKMNLNFYCYDFEGCTKTLKYTKKELFMIGT